MKRRVLCVLLALALCLSAVPAALAAENDRAEAAAEASAAEVLADGCEPSPQDVGSETADGCEPSLQQAGEESGDGWEPSPEDVEPERAEESVWEAIAALEAERLPDGGGEADYAALFPEVEALVTARADYVPGSALYQDDLLLWKTLDGKTNGYCPALRSEKAAAARRAANAEPLSETERAEIEQILAEAERARSENEAEAELMGIGENTYYDAAFFSPHFNEKVWEYRFNLTGFYKIQEISNYTHGNYEAYFNTNATIDNLASAIQHCCVVAINSHGSVNYLTLTTDEGITPADYNNSHAVDFGDGDFGVDGTCIVNHMTGPAAGGLVFLGYCHGMENQRMEKPLREAGVGVVVGFSRSVHHKFDDIVTEEFLDAIGKGLTVSKASQRMRERLVDRTGLAAQSVVYWDPWIGKVGDLLSITPEQARDHGAAFIIITSDEDPYPADTQTKQPVYSTWELPWREGWWTQDIEIVAPVGTEFKKYFGNAWVKKVEGTATLLQPEQIPATVHTGVTQIEDGGKKLYYSFLGGEFTFPGYWESEVALTTGDGVRETRKIKLMAYSNEPGSTVERSTIHEVGRSITWGVLGAPPYSAALLSGQLPEGTWMSDRGLVVGYPQETGVFNSSWRIITWEGETYDLNLSLTVRGEPKFYNQTVNEKEGTPLYLSLETGDDSGVYHMELIDGALPPGISMGYSQSEAPYIRGACDTPGDYSVKLRIVTGQLQTVVHTVSFRIYRALHQLDYLRLDLTKGPAYLPANLYECVSTSLSYAARSGQITANDTSFDLDQDGRLDVRLNLRLKTVELLSANSLSGDFYLLEMNAATRKLLNDDGKLLWYESLNFWLVEYYFLLIDGTPVTSRNLKDVLGNGVFSFDGLSTLTIRGDYSGRTTEPLIESALPGLTVRTEQNVTLTAKDTGILVNASTTFTGPGLLDLRAKGAGVLCRREFSGKPDLTISDAALRINAGTSALVCDETNGSCDLTVIRSDVKLKGKTSAADGFGDIRLYRDAITEPLQGASIYNGSLRDENYALLKEATISAYTEIYDLWVDGVQVTDSNRMDVLQNGVFFYDDKDNTLLIRGSYAGAEAYSNNLIESRIAGLTISAAQNAALTSAGPYVLWLIGGDATILGGPLTLKSTWGGSGAAICLDDSASLSVEDAELKLEGSAYGILGRSWGNDARFLHSDVEITAREACVYVYGSFAWANCDLTGGELRSDSGLDQLVDPEDGSRAATHVRFDANSHYGLHIDGLELTEHSLDRLPAAFSYDPAHNVLTVNGDFTAENDNAIWNEQNEGLTIRVAADAALTGPDGASTLFFQGSTTITGPGTLTLTGSSNYALGVYGNAVITLDGATLISDGALRGLYGYPKLIVKNTSLRATAKPGAYARYGAVYGFQSWGSWGGIELVSCDVTAPAGGGVAPGTGMVVDASGNPAGEVEIAPVWQYDRSAKKLRVSDTVSAARPVLAASYSASGQFLGLVTLTKGGDYAADRLLREGGRSLKLCWVDRSEARPNCAAETLYP